MAADFLHHANRKWMFAGVAATLVIVLIFALAFLKSWQRIHQLPEQGIKNTPAFVGREKCRDCHRNEYEKHKNSDHDRAMELADDTTVLGNFNDATFILLTFFLCGFFNHIKSLHDNPATNPVYF